MTKLHLGNINIIEPIIEAPTFIVGDIYEGGGCEDPIFITTLRELRLKCRYAKHYNAWKRIISAGGSLYIAGCRENFDDYSTLLVFNRKGYNFPDKYYDAINQSAIPYSYLPYKYFEFTDKELRELFKQTSHLSIISNLFRVVGKNNSKELFRVSNYNSSLLRVKLGIHLDDIKDTNFNNVISQYHGFSPYFYYTYKIKIPLTESSFNKLKSYINEKDSNGNYVNTSIPRILFIPSEVDTSLGWEYECYGIVFQNSKTKYTDAYWNTLYELDTSGSKRIQQYVFIEINEDTTYQDFLNSFINKDSSKVYSNIANPSRYSGAIGMVKIDTNDSILYENVLERCFSTNSFASIENNTLILESSSLIRFYDLSEEYLPEFEFINDIDFTQLIYTLRGLTQGLVLKCHSTVTGKESDDIPINISCSNDQGTLSYDYLDYSKEINGTAEIIRKEFIGDNLIDIDYIDFSNYEIDPKYEYFLKCDSNIKRKYSLDSLINAYESFLEYECNCSITIFDSSLFNSKDQLVDESVTERFSSLISVFIQLLKNHPNGGLDTTLCIQYPIIENSDLLIESFTRRFQEIQDLGHVYAFQGGITDDSVYEYIIKYLRDKAFTPDEGIGTIYSGDSLKALTITYDEVTGNIDYDHNPWEFMVDIGISHVINAIYQRVSPGMYKDRADEECIKAINEAIEFNPLIDSVSHEITQQGSILKINLIIYYISLDEEKKINFNIYI